MLNDVTSVALRSALNGLSARQRVIADNIANIETPGFRAGKVSFEGALAAALSSGDSPAISPTTDRSLEPTRLNGSNVNLDEETLSNVDTGLRYQLMLRAMDDRAKLVSETLKGLR